MREGAVLSEVDYAATGTYVQCTQNTTNNVVDM